MIRRVAVASFLLATLGVVAVSIPRMHGIRVDAPVDSSLRIPALASTLGNTSPWRVGDEIVAVELPGSHAVLPLADRRTLDHIIGTRALRGPLTFKVARSDAIVEIRARVGTPSLAGQLSQTWSVLASGLAHLAFGTLVFLGTAHPVATPLFATTGLAGLSLLGAVDLVLPRDLTGWARLELAARWSSMAFMVLPAALIHLGMRFPVVGTRFRRARMAVLPYLLWLPLVAFHQIHFHDGSLRAGLEYIALGATAIAGSVILSASWLLRRSLTTIERSRARSLALGLSACAIALLALRANHHLPGAVVEAAPLAFIGLPIAMGWAVVRYRLLEPPPWLRESIFSAITATAALLVVGLAIDAGVAEPEASAPTFFVIGALVAYQVTRGLLLRIVRPRVFHPQAFERLLTEALDRLGRARTPALVGRALTEICQTHLQALATEFQQGLPRPQSVLGERAEQLWMSRGRPRQGILVMPERRQDPGPDEPEVVVPLTPVDGRTQLLVLAARRDALPYSSEQLQMLDALAHIATATLGNVATASQLEKRIAMETHAVRRSLRDRTSVLEAARRICESETSSEVLAAVEAFVRGAGLEPYWTDAPPADDAGFVATCLFGGPGVSWTLLARTTRPDRARELKPQLQTVSVFASLAIARLQLLAELKQETDRQAIEIAEITSRKLHAEFVRGVAHELRKPAEEIYAITRELLERAPLRSDLERRAFCASSEMTRRLDLLLTHSGIRLDWRRIDLARIIDLALAKTAHRSPQRRLHFSGASGRLPIVGDPTRLASLIENLLDNAVRATTRGGRITVHARPVSPEGCGREPPWILIEVMDDGVGLPQGQETRIFEPGVSFLPGGFGLGLSLCREIVRLHGGTITAARLDSGCAIRVLIPSFARSVEEFPGVETLKGPELDRSSDAEVSIATNGWRS